jgi:hypothetical protein
MHFKMGLRPIENDKVTLGGSYLVRQPFEAYMKHAPIPYIYNRGHICESARPRARAKPQPGRSPKPHKHVTLNIIQSTYISRHKR